MNLPPVLKQYWTDANGNPLAGGKIYSYQAGTTTPQATYTDQGGGTPNANPVVLDASGWAPMWLDPELSYKFVVKDSSDNTLHTVDNVIGLLTADAVGPSALQDEAVESEHLSTKAIHEQTQDTSPATADEILTYDASAAALKRVTLDDLINLITPTGMVSPFAGSTAPSGWLLASGKTIGNGSSGGTARANADTSDLFVLLWNGFTNTELVIQDSAGSNTTRGASAAADFAANKRMPLPDLRGRVIAGLDNMDSVGAASRLTSSYFGADATVLGKAGGSESHTLTTVQIPSHQHSLDTTKHTPGGAYGGVGGSEYVTTDTDSLTGATGGGGAHNNVQPTIVMSYIIKL